LDEQKAFQDAREKEQARLQAAALNEQKIPCYLCGECFGYHQKRTRPTRDHVIPKSHLGGKPMRGNMRWAHFQCNQTKSNMPVVYFRMLFIFSKTSGGSLQMLNIRIKSALCERYFARLR